MTMTEETTERATTLLDAARHADVVERLQNHHVARLLIVGDEASAEAELAADLGVGAIEHCADCEQLLSALALRGANSNGMERTAGLLQVFDSELKPIGNHTKLLYAAGRASIASMTNPISGHMTKVLI